MDPCVVHTRPLSAISSLPTSPLMTSSLDDEGYTTPVEDEKTAVGRDGSSRFAFFRSYVPPFGYTLIKSIPLETMDHASFCSEGGRCRHHRGIHPGYPKGFYCCRDIASSFFAVKTIRIVRGA